MRGKLKFRWKGHQERSVFEIVSEDGTMKTKEILFIIQQVCVLLQETDPEETPGQSALIHPENIFVNTEGIIRISGTVLPRPAMEPYLPPERGRAEESFPAAEVYAVGMLMLFMATGQEKKAAADLSGLDRAFRGVLARCIAFDPQERFRDLKETLKAVKRVGGTGRKTLFALLAAALVCLALGLAFLAFQEGRAKGKIKGEDAGYAAGYAGGYEQGFSDAPGIGLDSAPFDDKNGNLSGNLAPEGRAAAARSEEEVFFLMEGSIFRMDPYTEDVRPLVFEAGAYSLNYYDGWLYYCTEEMVFRIEPRTMKKEAFCDSRGGVFYIADGVFYLYDSSGTGYLYRVDPDTRAMTQLNGAMEYRCLNIAGEKLYYIDPGSGSGIYSSDLDGSALRLISSSPYDCFCIYEGNIYAVAGSAGNEASGQPSGGLIRMDLNGGNIESLTTLPAESPNVTAGGIFYIAGKKRALEWMSLDGSMRYTVVSSSAGSFQVAGRWIFYRNEEDGGSLWRVRIDGSDNQRIAP